MHCPAKSKQEKNAKNRGDHEEEQHRHHQGQWIAINRHRTHAFPGHQPDSPDEHRGRHPHVVDLPAKCLGLQASYAKKNGGGRAIKSGRQGSCGGGEISDCHPNSRGAATGVTRKSVTRTRQQASRPQTLGERPVRQSRPMAANASSAMIGRTVCLQIFISALHLKYLRTKRTGEVQSRVYCRVPGALTFSRSVVEVVPAVPATKNL